MTSPYIALHQDGIWIDGKPHILLVSSLFYFRIPAAEWRNRMRTLRSLGYKAIDVYFPWNYHELEPGQWNFDGQRDARAFLQLAKEEGLWVIARPGPYICSEWDGGSLPAYLNVIPGLKLRDNNPAYMDAVRCWYDQILPMLAEFQVDRGGTILLVQIENELDFYECADRAGMMIALRDMARSHGIHVPLIACSGQGDLFGATGGIEGVAPTCNVYFDYRDPSIEPRVRHYDSLVRKQGYPLCVIETNRSHTDLRRLIAGGAKLLGPYLQTGGTDFGFTTGITNWGDPLAFMTSHYDFGGMISPAGKVRPEGCEAIILSKMLDAFGAALALAASVNVPPVAVYGANGHALALEGGGWLIGVSNQSDDALPVSFGAENNAFPTRTELRVAPNTCPFVLVEYPLPNVQGKIAYATAELVACQHEENSLALTFAVDAAAELVLQCPDVAPLHCTGWQLESLSDGWRLWMDDTAAAPAEIEFTGPGGKRVLIQATKRAEIGSLEKAGLTASQLFPASPTVPNSSSIENIDWRLASINSQDPIWFASSRACQPEKMHLEENGISQGFGWYRSVFHESDLVLGFLVRSGADVLSLYANEHFLGTIVPGGGDAYVSLPMGFQLLASCEVVVRAEIWGHANFDDHRLPALRLQSKRGLGGLVAVRHAENLSANWFYQRKTQTPAHEISPCFPLITFGSWISTDEPLQGVYHRDVSFVSGANTRVLHFPGIQSTSRVFVGGQMVGVVNPLNPFLDVSAASRPGETIQIDIVTDQPFRRSTGEVWLYQGNTLQTWELAAWGESQLASMGGNPDLAGLATKFPISLTRGAMAWLHVDLPLANEWERGWGVRFAGQGIKISAWVGNRLVGRIWLPSEMRPRMAAGLDDRMVLPASWLREAGGKLHLLLESVGDAPLGELDDVEFILDV